MRHPAFLPTQTAMIRPKLMLSSFCLPFDLVILHSGTISVPPLMLCSADWTGSVHRQASDKLRRCRQLQPNYISRNCSDY